MNLLGLLSLLWQILKSTVANETVNKAMHNWTKGTSNTIDDMVWKLLEEVTGVKDEETRAIMLEDGLRAIEEQYEVAKLDAQKMEAMKKFTRTWTPPTLADIQCSLTGEKPFNPETDLG